MNVYVCFETVDKMFWYCHIVFSTKELADGWVENWPEHRRYEVIALV